MTFVESSMKAGCLSLKTLQSRMTFVESSIKAGWLSLKAVRKQDGFR